MYAENYVFLEWDVIDKNEKPHLIEYNLEGYGAWAFQYTVAGALGSYTDEIIAYCKEKQNEIEEIVHL